MRIEEQDTTPKSAEFSKNIEQVVYSSIRKLELTPVEVENWNNYVEFVQQKTGKNFDKSMFSKHESFQQRQIRDNKIIKPSLYKYTKREMTG